MVAWTESSHQIDLKGPRHRAVLARLVVARGRVVPVDVIVDDLWVDPPSGATSAIRTFVSALRRALEPDRAPRKKPKVIVTEGPGYAFHAARRGRRLGIRKTGARSRRFDAGAITRTAPNRAATVERAGLRGVRRRALGPNGAIALGGTASDCVERLASAQLDLGRAAEAIPALDAHVTEHPWREDGWRLLALALYRSDRQGDALAVLRRARKLLAEELGIDPGPRLNDLESDILRRETHLDPAGAEQIFSQVSAAYDRTVAAGSKSRLESTVGLLRSLAVAGGSGLETARNQRLTIIGAAEQLDDVELTARIIGNYDVPGIWTRSDDPRQATQIVEAAQRTLDRLPAGNEPARARLLATIALESRGLPGHHGLECACRSTDRSRSRRSRLLAFALNGLFMQTFWTTGLASERDDIGRELVDLAIRHGLATFEILGHLIRMQALSALGQFDAAELHAETVDRLAGRHERPLQQCSPPGFALCVLPLPARRPRTARSCTKLRRSIFPIPVCRVSRTAYSLSQFSPSAYGGDCRRFSTRLRSGPLRTLGPATPAHRTGADERSSEGRRGIAGPARRPTLRGTVCLTAAAATAVGDHRVKERARAALLPAAAEIAGAGSGMLTVGPVSHYLAELEQAEPSGECNHRLTPRLPDLAVEISDDGIAFVDQQCRACVGVVSGPPRVRTQFAIVPAS